MSNIQSQATSQLGAIPFGSLIGGPLNAAVEAQAQAANTSVEFIKQVAIKDDGEVRNVTFFYMKEESKVELTVPILAIVPIPYLRIDDMTINFKAKISADTSTNDKSSSSSSVDVNASASAGWGWGKAKFSAGYSSKKDSSSSRDSKYSVEYTMDISVHAVQDDMPGGLEKVLNMLEKSIESAPALKSPAQIAIETSPEIKTAGGDAEIIVTVTDKEGDAVSNDTIVKCITAGITGKITVNGKATNRAKTADGKATFKFSYDAVNEGDQLDLTFVAGAAEDLSISVKATT
ncbi:MAG: DUF2589 domain-containing protein [Rhodothermaceae bacterium]